MTRGGFKIHVVLAILIALGFESPALSQYTPLGYRIFGFGNNMYGAKTAYFWAYPDTNPVPRNRLMYTQYEGNNCTAVHVNVVSRHGARYISASEMRSFTVLHDKLIAEVGNQNHLSFLKRWRNRYPEASANLMTSLGLREMDYLGSNIGAQLRNLLSKDGTTLDNGAIKFGATRVKRTQTSARYFQNGLSKGVLDRNDTSLPVNIRDNVLRFYDNCKKYEDAIKHNDEVTKFQNGPEMQKVRGEITARLQMNTTLTADEVKLIYLLCATELAIMDDAGWCLFMTDEHRDVLEYENDLQDYYNRLYGYNVTGQMSCPLVSDVFTAIDSAITGHENGRDYTSGVFQFGHADTVIDFAANLGFFNDQIRFRADNYDQLKNRLFNSAKVDPFSTHFTFILYSCGGTGPQNYVLRLLFNGRPLSFPVCNSDICRYDQVRQSYSQSIDHCDWANACGVTQPGVPIGK